MNYSSIKIPIPKDGYQALPLVTNQCVCVCMCISVLYPMYFFQRFCLCYCYECFLRNSQISPDHQQIFNQSLSLLTTFLGSTNAVTGMVLLFFFFILKNAVAILSREHSLHLPKNVSSSTLDHRPARKNGHKVVKSRFRVKLIFW